MVAQVDYFYSQFHLKREEVVNVNIREPRSTKRFGNFVFTQQYPNTDSVRAAGQIIRLEFTYSPKAILLHRDAKGVLHPILREEWANRALVLMHAGRYNLDGYCPVCNRSDKPRSAPSVLCLLPPRETAVREKRN